jgi:branched-chain amino acid transport system ATP-binding protein
VSALEVRDLEVRYGVVRAVQGVDLRVDEGELVVVLGANGAGKSSVLQAISGSLRPAGGTITFQGKAVAGRPAHKVARSGLVLVPEGRRIFGPLTVEENLLIGGYIQSRSRREQLLRETYEMFPILAERRTGPAGLLSGGEQQMLAFGRALMSSPSLLLLDEPSMGLAPVIVKSIMSSIAAIRARGLSILMVEQNAAALDTASRAYVMEQGRIVLEGAPDTIIDDPIVARAFLGITEPI